MPMNNPQQRSRIFSPARLSMLIAVPAALYVAWDLVNAGKLSFQRPWVLLFGLCLPLAYWVLFKRRQRGLPHLRFSNAVAAKQTKPGLVSRLVALPSALRFVALALLIFALAGPRTRDRGGYVEVEGIDIVVALDVSMSMEAADLRPNRLNAAKKVLDDFVTRRKSDRIGLILFGKEAYTHCPLTLDYSVLREMLQDVQLGLIDGHATAIGNALALSLARLRNSDAKSRVVILLTDGDSNAGNVMPEEAARYAHTMGVKVFTILMGPTGETQTRRVDLFGRPVATYAVNPQLLQKIATETGGKAFVATDRRALEHNFEQILDALDKDSRRDVGAVYTAAFRPSLVLALLLLLLEQVLRLTRFREFP